MTVDRLVRPHAQNDIGCAMDDTPTTAPGVELVDPRDGRRLGLPVIEPSLGKPMVDMRKQPKGQERYWYDPGLSMTGICRSSTTYAHRDEGIRPFRANPTADLL